MIDLKIIVDEIELGPDPAYNAVQRGLFWCLLPNKKFVHRAEASAPGCKLVKDRIPPMPSTNASHKLQMLVIGKCKSPRGFKNVNLTVLYTNPN